MSLREPTCPADCDGWFRRSGPDFNLKEAVGRVAGAAGTRFREPVVHPVPRPGRPGNVAAVTNANGRSMGVRIGIDTGGTFTDLIGLDKATGGLVFLVLERLQGFGGRPRSGCFVEKGETKSMIN
jgi:hypothetical protein